MMLPWPEFLERLITDLKPAELIALFMRSRLSTSAWHKLTQGIVGRLTGRPYGGNSPNLILTFFIRIKFGATAVQCQQQKDVDSKSIRVLRM